MASRVVCWLAGVSLLLLIAFSVVYGMLVYFVVPGVPGTAGLPRVPLSDDEVKSRTSEDVLSSNATEAFLAAVQAIEERDYPTALSELARCGDDDAACRGLRGTLQLSGETGPRNFSNGLQQLVAAAELGDADAQFSLGALYANLVEEVPGPSFKRQEDLSVLYLYAASVSGHPGALMAMGYRHLQGHGVPKSCSTSALNYIEVARRVADVYSAGMPQAVELVRLGVDGKDRKGLTASEVSLFEEIALNGDANVAAAVGKRYLLGIDGFRQSYSQAVRHLQMAADKKHGGALALLGYMYCLGLGVAKSKDVAYSYFTLSVAQGNALGHNGLGYLFFHGSEIQKQDLAQAVTHFNASAHGGSADGMFNLASLYLTGTGVAQSFQRAAWWFTQALDRGHTPAAYTLAVMHLNGIGTARNCKVAVDLLKRVCERGSWVSRQLQDAYEHYGDGRPDAAAWRFLRLAEAGHDVAQMNLAHLLDIGVSSLLLDEQTAPETPDQVRSLNRVQAQRHWELSAEQGNVLAELRLGDYAYFGWGLRLKGGLADEEADVLAAEGEPSKEEEGAEEWETLSILSEYQLVPQEADVGLALARYQRTAAARVSSDWMQPFVARANFNVGFMHQFGSGVPRDRALARRYYNRCLEVDPAGVQAPILVMLGLLAIQSFFGRMPSLDTIAAVAVADIRFHFLVVNVVALLVLLYLRVSFSGMRRRLTGPAPGHGGLSSSVWNQTNQTRSRPSSPSTDALATRGPSVEEASTVPEGLASASARSPPSAREAASGSGPPASPGGGADGLRHRAAGET